jgi:hypothetical protein
MTSSPPGRTRRNRLRLICLLACSILLSSTAIATAARRSHASAASRAHAAHVLPKPLKRAAAASARADRRLVLAANTLRHCRSVHPGHCAGARHNVQAAGRALARAQRSLAQIARLGRTGGTGSSELAAPVLSVSGQTLTWTRVANINTYVFVRKVPGQPDQYSLVNGTSTTPPPVPGATVSYGVRTSVSGSYWAAEKSITYPAPTQPAPTPTPTPTPTPEPTPTPAPEPVETINTLAAPVITVSGQTLTWNATAGVTTYVFVRKVSGLADQYSEVTGTSITPPAVPGGTVHFSVRTAVTGSAWASEVAISYPSSTVAPPPPPPPPPAGEAPFHMGVVSGSAPLYELSFINSVKAHAARVEFSIGTTAAQMEPTIAAFAQNGVKVMPLAGFGGTLPTPEEARNVASWAARFGPGGSFWVGKSYPASTAVTKIEFGNETSYSYQYSDNSTSGYASRAQTYALRFKEAAIATQAANPNVGILAQGDPGNGSGTAWMDNMFVAVPNLGQYVAGWTVHPYGPGWAAIMDKVVSSAKADGASSAIPLDVTEWGLASDNGRCLDSNYGWNKCMSYSEAATTLGSTVSSMLARYPGRLEAFFLYDAHDLQATGTSTSRENYFGGLQSNGATKGAYTTTVESLLAANV